MAEDFGDKTEEPTPRRREEAREQGNIARSPDLTAAVLLVGGLLLLNSFGGRILSALSSVVRQMLSEESLSSVDTADVGHHAVTMFMTVAISMLPLFAGLVVIALAINIAQVGFHIVPSKLAPNFDALNPVKGAGRLFKGQGIMRLVMGIAKMALVALTAYSAIHSRLNLIIGIERLDFMQMFTLGGEVMFSIGIRVGALLIVLAAIDYFWQRRQVEQSLKMTKQEVKDDLRRSEGDPKIKMRRRQIAQEISRRKLAKDVPTADVVITNPTEYAIALKYDADTMHAPRVIAKGRGLIAQRIRELAIAAGVPILERKPLARALFRLVEVGQEIPEEFYNAVAEILSYVYQLTGRIRKSKA